LSTNKKGLAITAVLLLIFFGSCNTEPQPIKIGTDTCIFCKMTISDNRFGGEILTKKGKTYKFDDIHCLTSFKKSDALNKEIIKSIYFVNFEATHNFIEASKSHLFKSDAFHTPMAGNIAAFDNEHSLNNIAQKFKGSEVTWNDLVK
jgi:copper chaperone NosL